MVFDEIIKYVLRDGWKKEERSNVRINERIVLCLWVDKLFFKLFKGEKFIFLIFRFLYFFIEKKV